MYTVLYISCVVLCEEAAIEWKTNIVVIRVLSGAKNSDWNGKVLIVPFLGRPGSTSGNSPKVSRRHALLHVAWISGCAQRSACCRQRNVALLSRTFYVARIIIRDVRKPRIDSQTLGTTNMVILSCLWNQNAPVVVENFATRLPVYVHYASDNCDPEIISVRAKETMYTPSVVVWDTIFCNCILEIVLVAVFPGTTYIRRCWIGLVGFLYETNIPRQKRPCYCWPITNYEFWRNPWIYADWRSCGHMWLAW